MPALHLFQLQRRVEDYPYGEEVVDTLKVAFLLLHFLPYTVDALCTSFHVEVEARLFELLPDRCDELLDIPVAVGFRFVELRLYHVVCVVLKIFQAQVFKLAF